MMNTGKSLVKFYFLVFYFYPKEEPVMKLSSDFTKMSLIEIKVSSYEVPLVNMWVLRGKSIRSRY